MLKGWDEPEPGGCYDIFLYFSVREILACYNLVTFNSSTVKAYMSLWLRIDINWDQELQHHQWYRRIGIIEVLAGICGIKNRIRNIPTEKWTKNLNKAKRQRKMSYLSAVEEAFLWHITAKELLPGVISCLISHATRLLGFTARKLMPDWNHTLQRWWKRRPKEREEREGNVTEQEEAQG